MKFFRFLNHLRFWHIHRWAFSQKLLIGPVFVAEHVCSECGKKSYIPYCSDDRYFDIECT